MAKIGPLLTYLYLWMMDHRSISFRAGPYRGSNHLASSWRSWLMVLLRCVAARSSSCWRLFEKKRTSWSRVYSASCTASDYVLLCVDLIPLAEKKVLLSTFSFPDRILNVSMRSPLILRLFNVVSPKMCSLSKYFCLSSLLHTLWPFSELSPVPLHLWKNVGSSPAHNILGEF